MENTANKSAKEIREMLKSNCFYTYHIWGDGLRARICGVRVKAGTLEVKHLNAGTWHAVGGGHVTQLRLHPGGYETRPVL